jgi:hypothetical protein
LSIRRLYRSGAWLRLRFNQKEALEAEELWGKAVSDTVAFTVRIFDQDHWKSPPIAVRFLEMKDRVSTKNRATTDYLADDSYQAKHMIKNTLDVFEALVGEADPRDPNRVAVDILVGCYTANGQENAIDIVIVDSDGVVHEYSDFDTYERTRSVEEALLASQLARRIRRHIFAIYPLQGVVCNVEPLEHRPADEQTPHKLREVRLNIGSLAGVWTGDVFETLPSSNRGYSAGLRLTVDCVTPKGATAFVPWEEEVEKGWCVRWVRGG